MKKKCIRAFAGMLIMATMMLPACEFFEHCGTCEQVIDDGTNITYGEERLVCGDAYWDLFYAEEEVNNGVTTYWNCN